jgi:hypothetical protein
MHSNIVGGALSALSFAKELDAGVGAFSRGLIEMSEITKTSTKIDAILPFMGY